jgi:lipopolysaccharide transport system ATP-binding protein
MSNTVIKVENLSKQYRLGKVGTGTLSQDLSRWWSLVRGKEDPFLKIGESNDRTSKGLSEYVWSLKDINFEVNQGDTLGIIGRNGAGKSTLLKILSKVTGPTTGNIKIKGRIASLLEVGTGFHPELSGRENIFLNGAILGMSKNEIKKKFDEIVDFSGVDRYIDTPVKRYSSGMYVRLAFAVAAHLESEILIIDEVLAVGDAEFQKKCLGKMNDVSKGEGRTVLFVSHNMAAVENLCNKGIVLNNGNMIFEGGSKESIDYYFKNQKSVVENQKISSKYVDEISILNSEREKISELEMGNNFTIQIKAKGISEVSGLNMGFFIKDIYDQKIAAFSTAMKLPILLDSQRSNNEIFEFNIINPPLLEGKYIIDISIAYKKGGRLEYIENAYSFDVLSKDIYGSGVMLNNYFGKIYLNAETTIKSI